MWSDEHALQVAYYNESFVLGDRLVVQTMEICLDETVLDRTGRKAWSGSKLQSLYLVRVYTDNHCKWLPVDIG